MPLVFYVSIVSSTQTTWVPSPMAFLRASLANLICLGTRALDDAGTTLVDLTIFFLTPSYLYPECRVVVDIDVGAHLALNNTVRSSRIRVCH